MKLADSRQASRMNEHKRKFSNKMVNIPSSGAASGAS